MIRLSGKHGVNPSIGKCFYCLEDDAIVLFGALPDDAEAPRCCGVINLQPCHKCKEHMKQGIILISVQDGGMASLEKEQREYMAKLEALPEAKKKRARPFIPNPYRTGGWWVVTEDGLKSILGADSEVFEKVNKHRWSFVEDSVAESIGLKREKNEPDLYLKCKEK
jgi:hypothetical protein